jgi:sulfur carrier protein ThiS
MHIAVRHNLQVFDPADPSLCESGAIVLPIAEAQAAMGETVAAYLARVAWRFDLPTVCRINGEFYARAEWETRALAVNDNVEFISRPLGGGSSGGSTGKSILSVVALVALTAVAPYAVGAIGGALGTAALGTAASLTFAGKLAAAVIVGAGALAVSHFLQPKSGGKTNSTDALYSFGLQGNAARPMQPIPVLNGRLRFAPDYAAPTYSEYAGDAMTDYALYALTCGRMRVEQVLIGDTPIWNYQSGYSPDYPGIELQIVEPGEPVPDGANFAASLAGGLMVLGLCALGVGLILLLGWLLFDRREPLGARLAFAAMLAVLVALAVASPASAAEVATVGDKAVIVPWGDWLVALAVSLREPILTILIPIIAGYVIQAIRKVYPWATLFLSQRRVEMMLEAAVGFGLNAVQGAAKGKTLSANVAVPVIAKGTQYVIDTAPPRSHQGGRRRRRHRGAHVPQARPRRPRQRAERADPGAGADRRWHGDGRRAARGGSDDPRLSLTRGSNPGGAMHVTWRDHLGGKSLGPRATSLPPASHACRGS